MKNPKPWTDRAQHAVMPQGSHDEAARFNAIANLNSFLATRLVPRVQAAFEQRGSQAFRLAHGRDPATRSDVAACLESDPAYQSWSCLRRNAMEMRQQTGRNLVLRQAEQLAARAAALNAGSDMLKLNPDLAVPDYVAAGDQHLMPGGYARELVPGDVGPAANYDAGMFATIGGQSGPLNDLAGRTLAAWLKDTHPDFKPRRILDLGCGMGHNTLPLRAAFPDAEIVAIDVAAPMLRYGHARAKALGYTDIRFLQVDAANTGFADRSFDLVVTAMVLHETSRDAVQAILAESQRLLTAGGLTVHVEQPPYRQFGPFEQFMRDWDGRNNNEPFWSELHEMRLTDVLVDSGFVRGDVFEATLAAPRANAAPGVEAEDFGRAPRWYAVGAWRHGLTAPAYLQGAVAA